MLRSKKSVKVTKPLLEGEAHLFDQTSGVTAQYDSVPQEHGRTQMNRVAEGSAITGIFTGAI